MRINELHIYIENNYIDNNQILWIYYNVCIYTEQTKREYIYFNQQFKNAIEWEPDRFLGDLSNIYRLKLISSLLYYFYFPLCEHKTK